MPTRSYFSWIAIPALYHKVHEELRAMLKCADMGHVSGTVDLWSSSAMELYLYTQFTLCNYFMGAQKLLLSGSLHA